MKAVLTSLNMAFLPISSSRFNERQIPLFISLTRQCFAVLCKVLGDFGAFWERDIFFSKDKLH